MNGKTDSPVRKRGRNRNAWLIGVVMLVAIVWMVRGIWRD
jgi:hypothetical protein